MLNRIPRSLPTLSMMLDDLGHPKTEALARALGVSPSTARRWIAADSAPMPVLLAIFWLTSWGRHAVDCEAHNAACMHAAMARLLRIELADITARLHRVGRLADFRSANDPAESVHLPLPGGDAGNSSAPYVRTGNQQNNQQLSQVEAPVQPAVEPGSPSGLRAECGA